VLNKNAGRALESLKSTAPPVRQERFHLLDVNSCITPRLAQRQRQAERARFERASAVDIQYEPNASGSPPVKLCNVGNNHQQAPE
jgi:hypothetical protein